MTHYFTKEQDQQWRAAQPKKLVGSKVVVTSKSGLILLLKPTYKPTWQLPGGVVEAGESPAAAALREMNEEVGMVCQEADLNLIDVVFRSDQDVLLTMYELTIPQDDSISIKVQASELEAYEWLRPSEVAARLPAYYADFLARYVK